MEYIKDVVRAAIYGSLGYVLALIFVRLFPSLTLTSV